MKRDSTPKATAPDHHKSSAWSSRLPWLLAVILVLVPFFVPIPRTLHRHVLIGLVGYMLHIPLMATVTLLLYWRGPVAGRIWATAGLSVLIGGSIEFLQILVGRTALWIDFLLDLIGIGIALSWIYWRRSRQGRYLLIGLLLVILALLEIRDVPGLVSARLDAQARFPMIDDFETASSIRLWDKISDGHIAPVPSATAQGTVLRVIGGPPGPWPGAHIRRFPHDWRGWRELSFVARAIPPSAAEVRFGVTLGDVRGRHEHEWVSDRFAATAEWQTFSIDLQVARTRQSGRPLDLDDIGGIVFFFPAPADSVGMEIDDIRLR